MKGLILFLSALVLVAGKLQPPRSDIHEEFVSAKAATHQPSHYHKGHRVSVPQHNDEETSQVLEQVKEGSAESPKNDENDPNANQEHHHAATPHISRTTQSVMSWLKTAADLHKHGQGQGQGQAQVTDKTNQTTGPEVDSDAESDAEAEQVNEHTEKHSEKHTEKHAEKHSERQEEKHEEKHTEKHTEKHAEKHAEKKAEKHVEHHSQHHNAPVVAKHTSSALRDHERVVEQIKSLMDSAESVESIESHFNGDDSHELLEMGEGSGIRHSHSIRQAPDSMRLQRRHPAKNIPSLSPALQAQSEQVHNEILDVVKVHHHEPKLHIPTASVSSDPHEALLDELVLSQTGVPKIPSRRVADFRVVPSASKPTGLVAAGVAATADSTNTTATTGNTTGCNCNCSSSSASSDPMAALSGAFPNSSSSNGSMSIGSLAGAFSGNGSTAFSGNASSVFSSNSSSSLGSIFSSNNTNSTFDLASGNSSVFSNSSSLGNAFGSMFPNATADNSTSPFSNISSALNSTDNSFSGDVLGNATNSAFGALSSAMGGGSDNGTAMDAFGALLNQTISASNATGNSTTNSTTSTSSTTTKPLVSAVQEAVISSPSAAEKMFDLKKLLLADLGVSTDHKHSSQNIQLMRTHLDQSLVQNDAATTPTEPVSAFTKIVPESSETETPVVETTPATALESVIFNPHNDIANLESLPSDPTNTAEEQHQQHEESASPLPTPEPIDPTPCPKKEISQQVAIQIESAIDDSDVDPMFDNQSENVPEDIKNAPLRATEASVPIQPLVETDPYEIPHEYKHWRELELFRDPSTQAPDITSVSVTKPAPPATATVATSAPAIENVHESTTAAATTSNAKRVSDAIDDALGRDPFYQQPTKVKVATAGVREVPKPVMLQQDSPAAASNVQMPIVLPVHVQTAGEALARKLIEMEAELPPFSFLPQQQPLQPKQPQQKVQQQPQQPQQLPQQWQPQPQFQMPFQWPQPQPQQQGFPMPFQMNMFGAPPMAMW